MTARHLCLIAVLILCAAPARSASPVADPALAGAPDGGVCVQSDSSGTVEAASGALTSPADIQTPPVQCLLTPNHGACVECCKAATGCGGDGPFPCNLCARFCGANVPPPPAPDEP
jgi:hypothetical protein